MQFNTQTALPALPAAQDKRNRRLFPLLRLLKRLDDAYYSYRQKQKLQELPDELLEDMGMTREDIASAFMRHGLSRSCEKP